MTTNVLNELIAVSGSVVFAGSVCSAAILVVGVQWAHLERMFGLRWTARMGLNRRWTEAALILWCSVVCTGCLAIAILLDAWPVAVTLAVLFLGLLPKAAVAELIRIRETKLRDQLTTVLFGLAGSVRAGLSLAEAVRCQADECDPPLADELLRIAHDHHHGATLQDAFRAARDRLNIHYFSLLTTVVTAALQRGGGVPDCLNRISHSIFESQRIRRRFESSTAAGRRSIHLLCTFPVVFLGGYSLLDPASVGIVLASRSGQWAISASAMLSAVALWSAQRILNSHE